MLLYSLYSDYVVLTCYFKGQKSVYPGSDCNRNDFCILVSHKPTKTTHPKSGRSEWGKIGQKRHYEVNEVKNWSHSKCLILKFFKCGRAWYYMKGLEKTNRSVICFWKSDSKWPRYQGSKVRVTECIMRIIVEIEPILSPCKLKKDQSNPSIVDENENMLFVCVLNKRCKIK